MKLLTLNNQITLYLNNMYLHNLDLENKDAIQNYIKQMFTKISIKYDIEFDGYYIVKLYVDKNYGIIIEIKKEELEYLDYFSNQIEINTEVTSDSFLYEIDDVDKNIFSKFIIYKLFDKLYLKIKNQLSNIEMGNILEHAQIIYGSKAKTIIKKGKIVR